MSVSVVVPFAGDGAERDRNWSFVCERLSTLHPDWEIVTHAGDGAAHFAKGSAVNPAVQKASGEVVVLHDADVFLPTKALPDAVQRLLSAPWVIPHMPLYRLNDRASKGVIAGRVNPAEIHGRSLKVGVHQGPAGGGCAIFRRADFTGMDEGFNGWGGDDVSFARAMDTMVGPHTRLGFPMWHLWHKPMVRRTRKRGSLANEAIANRYLAANGNPEAMQQLLEERMCPA